ncbi:hypothetical protein OIU78_015473 [Salix suchowensis]|nr:hypothetical protein OIU78_015473 [Salix suchowensis]
MSVRLLKKVLKEQELQQRQHRDVSEEEEEEEGDSPDSGTRPAINPFDLLNDDDVDQVFFINPSASCTTILTDKHQNVTYFFIHDYLYCFLFISLFLCCL